MSKQRQISPYSTKISRARQTWTILSICHGSKTSNNPYINLHHLMERVRAHMLQREYDKHILHISRLAPSNLHLMSIHQRHKQTLHHYHLTIWTQYYEKPRRHPTGIRTKMMKWHIPVDQNTGTDESTLDPEVHIATNKDRNKHEFGSKLAKNGT